MRRILEIHAAEGGADSQLLVKDLADIYFNLATRVG
jgi:protein subunit release factor A